MKNYLLLISLLITCLSCKNSKTIHTSPDIDFVKGESFLYKNSDSAFFYFNNVAIRNTDSLQTAEAYSYMAYLQSTAGDDYGAQESLTLSLKNLKESNRAHWLCIATDYNELGLTSMNFKHYNQALIYFNKALPFYLSPQFKLRALNNKAWAYRELKQYDKALAIYNKIIQQNTDSLEYARFLSNTAKTKWLQTPSYKAAAPLLKSLTIRKKANDSWGLNASYSHLSDYYNKIKPDSALYYASSMYKVALQLKSPDDQIEALQKLINLSPSTATKKYFTIYQGLADSLQTARSAAKNQFAAIRYESEKSKAANFELQKDNTAKKYQIIAILCISLFLLIIGVLWYRKRKQKITLKAENTIRENQLKTSKKVHDVVANGLYRVMTEIENQTEIDKDDVLDKIEDLYEKSRDISYDKPELNQKHFNIKISSLLTSFATADTKILIAGNTSTLWENLHTETKYEVEHVLQELMVNMKKHSGATNVVVKFELKNNEIYIHYTDNGVGMSEKTKHNNGLRNTGNRIASINGAIIFDSKVEKGLKIQISIPFS